MQLGGCVCPVWKKAIWKEGKNTAHAQGTIRDNIAYGVEDATDEQIMAAAEAANAMLFIKKAPGGFRTQAREFPNSARFCCADPCSTAVRLSMQGAGSTAHAWLLSKS